MSFGGFLLDLRCSGSIEIVGVVQAEMVVCSDVGCLADLRAVVDVWEDSDCYGEDSCYLLGKLDLSEETWLKMPPGFALWSGELTIPKNRKSYL